MPSLHRLSIKLFVFQAYIRKLLGRGLPEAFIGMSAAKDKSLRKDTRRKK